MNPKLPLTRYEKTQLRKAKVKMSEIHTYSASEIAHLLHISDEKAKIYKGLADFQTVPSIGHKVAEKLVLDLKIYSLNEIKDKKGADLFDELEQYLGVWTDGCVEDQIRCVIHYANHPFSTKRWFDFTEERKRDRKIVGFPSDRPRIAWYDNKE